LAGFVIPALPDVTKIPEPSWEGWSPVLEALGIERSNVQSVAHAVERAQHTLSGLLSAALVVEQPADPVQAEQPKAQPQVQCTAALACVLLPSACLIGSLGLHGFPGSQRPPHASMMGLCDWHRDVRLLLVTRHAEV
jgi:hypothetical protein